MKNSVILAATPDLEKSLNFYKKLKFTYLEIQGKHYFLDDSTLIEVSDEKSIRSGIKLYKQSWNTEVQSLEKITTVAKVKNGYALMDFTGTWVYLVEGEGVKTEVESSSRSLLGKIAGLSLEGISIAQMNSIWKVLGFEKTMGDESGGWMAVKNEDGLSISMMSLNACPHSFYNPSLTYFNGSQNLEVIENIRSLGFSITEEITVFNKEGIVDNVIIRDPGGFGFFIFSD